jgi:hypothetical protein
MEVVRKNFPPIIPDNEENYISIILAIISGIDSVASVEITRAPKTLYFQIAISHPKFLDKIVEEIIKFNKAIGIWINISKSIQSSAKVFFKVSWD